MPITLATHHPLHPEDLSPRDFERLCLWLVERESWERVEHLGAAGSELGRDIVAWREGRRWAFQCKRVKRFGPGDAETEIDKILGLPEDERPSELVFVVTCDVSATTRQRVRERCAEATIECHFWVGTELDHKIKRHLASLNEFFDRGVPQPAMPSLHQMPAPPSTFKGRGEDLDELAAAIRKGGVTISGVRGMGGIGKTALALKLAERLTPDYPDAQIFVDLKGTSASPLAATDAMGQVIRAVNLQAEPPASESERGGCTAPCSTTRRHCCWTTLPTPVGSSL